MKHHLSTLRGLALGLALVLGGALSRVDAGDPTKVDIETGAGLGKRTCDALDRFTSRVYSAMEAED